MYTNLIWLLVGAAGGGIGGYLIADLIAYKAEYEVYPSEQASPSDEKTEPFDIPVRSQAVSYTDYSRSMATLSTLAKKYIQDDGEKLNDDVSRFSILSYDTWVENDPRFQRATRSYYAEDGVYSDEDENIVANPQDGMGPNAHPHFGEGNDDPDVVYIRDSVGQTDYEVIRIHGSYASMVMGMPVKEAKPKSPKRKRSTKDENEELD